MPPQTSASPAVDLDINRLFHLYFAGEYERLSTEFLSVFEFFSNTTYLTLSDDNRANLLRFLKIFLTLFTQQDYIVPEKYVIPFIQQNFLLSNLMAMTAFRNTDGFLELVRFQPQNYVKILTLYSARNNLRFNRRGLFDSNPQLASLWYNQFCRMYKIGLIRDDIAQHLAEHLSYRDERMALAIDLQEPYFGSTYLDGQIDAQVKPFLNNVVRRSIQRLRCENHPNPKKIAVLSDCWFPDHSVYRINAAYVRELRPHFHLTFFHIERDRSRLDISMFDEVHRLEWKGRVLQIEPLLSNDFQVVYFPDVGMTLPSIMLANHRIAPIQICSLGHSVSTFGGEVDYYISGADVEGPDAAERHYSERLVLLPGMGAIHNRPLYEPIGNKKIGTELIINCPWTGQKINARFCRTLRKIIDQVQRPVRFRIFASVVSMHNSHLSFVADLRGVLGDKAILDVVPYCPYQEYMRLMEEGDFSLDSFHFGGCNTIADSLFLRKPTIVWEGDKWYNRIGPAMLRLVGLDEYICHNEEEFIEKTLQMIHNDQRRQEIAAKLRNTDLDSTVFGTVQAPMFRKAIEYLIANHDQLQRDSSRKPIVIS